MTDEPLGVCDAPGRAAKKLHRKDRIHTCANWRPVEANTPRPTKWVSSQQIQDVLSIAGNEDAIRCGMEDLLASAPAAPPDAELRELRAQILQLIGNNPSLDTGIWIRADRLRPFVARENELEGK